ncbi:MAG: hypothetical protein IPG24_01740 [Leptospiraceae bacterium]|nr:hypothetical protein [Leptospiraceae bacterium]
MNRKKSSLYQFGEYCNLTAKRLSVNILFAIFLISLCFCNVENPQSKNNKRNFSVFTFLVNNPIPVNSNTITTRVGNMNRSHTDPKAVLLENGNVLVVGRGAELFDSATLRYSIIPNRTLVRESHTLTRLQNGNILVLGGNTPSVEIYDPTTMTFSNTGNMLQRYRSWHTVTLLPSGKVLVVGGIDSYETGLPTNSFNSAEIYDPSTGVFTNTGNLNYPRQLHSATLLNDGKVLIIGGWNSQDNEVTTSEIYNPITGLFSEIPNSFCQSTRTETAILLGNKNVLVAKTQYPSNLQIFDSTVGNCSVLQHSLQGVGYFSIAQLNDGRVLLAGGWRDTTKFFVNELNIYEPNSNMFNYLGNMSKATSYPIMITLKDGRVLITGGTGDSSSRISEIYTPSGTPQ